MISFDENEARAFLAKIGLNQSQLILEGKSNHTPKIAGIRTEGKDALTIFDIARFFRAHIGFDPGVMVLIKSREPFSGQEENQLFDAYLTAKGLSVNNYLWFGNGDSECFVIILSLCIMFQWDFILYSSREPIFFEHSHDGGIDLYCGSEELVQAIIQTGLARNV